jgi:hypothetical protein
MISALNIQIQKTQDGVIIATCAHTNIILNYTKKD